MKKNNTHRPINCVVALEPLEKVDLTGRCFIAQGGDGAEPAILVYDRVSLEIHAELVSMDGFTIGIIGVGHPGTPILDVVRRVL